MTDRAYLDLALVRLAEPLAAAQRVSLVARGPAGFLRAYEAAGGDASRLWPGWAAKRRAFLARHVAQAKAQREGWWTAGGEPTRRHLALIMWAWTPTRARLEAHLGERPSPRAVGGSALRAWYDKQALAARRLIGDASLPLPRLRVHDLAEDWGGRFQPAKVPEVHVYPARSSAMNRAIALHELAHWVRHHTGDRVGEHDAIFCRVLDGMYRRARVPVSAARAVERIGGCLSQP